MSVITRMGAPMSNRHKHKLKIHKWVNGQLSTVEHVFRSLDEAKDFAKTVESGSVIKIYNVWDQIVFQIENSTNQSYA